MGYDADSTAAVAGGLAGLYYGFDDIPEEWIEDLAGKDVIADCLFSFENYVQTGEHGWRLLLDDEDLLF